MEGEKIDTSNKAYVEVINPATNELIDKVPLSTYEDVNFAFNVVNNLKIGFTIVNGASFYRLLEMPFCGCKYSGIGNEEISITQKEMSRIKIIVLKNIL